MSFADLLIHTCTIRRYTEGAVDAYGNPVKTWADYLVDQPCRLTSSSGREVTYDTQVVIADYRLFIAAVDITERDRVVISGKTYEVLLVEGYSDSAMHHLQCWMRIVR